MDKQVQLAMAKWPDVPDCYDWLGLDARGIWRMRDQRVQELGLPGDKITNMALCNFINRNYLSDAAGNYFFQNGPQRVYVRLESTPYIVRSDPQQHWLLHTGEVMEQPDTIWLTAEGQLILQSGQTIAQLDDRDVALAITRLRWHGQAIPDHQLLDRMAAPQPGLTFLSTQQNAIPAELSSLAELARRHPFVNTPTPPVLVS